MHHSGEAINKKSCLTSQAQGNTFYQVVVLLNLSFALPPPTFLQFYLYLDCRKDIHSFIYILYRSHYIPTAFYFVPVCPLVKFFAVSNISSFLTRTPPPLFTMFTTIIDRSYPILY